MTKSFLFSATLFNTMTLFNTIKISLLLFCLFLLSTQLLFAKSIKVGVYDNPPLIFINAQGEPTGLAIDILENVADQEGWTIKYITGNWQEIYNKLKQGKIDLMPGLEFTSRRANQFHLTHETLVNNWGIIYANPQIPISSVFDLRKRRIAVMKGSTHTKQFKKLFRQFGIEYILVEVNSYSEVLEKIDKGFADAGIINRLYSILNAHEYELVDTTLVFNPVEIKYASPRNIGTGLVLKIDYFLTTEKHDPKSFYHQSLKKWLSYPSHIHFPTWLGWTLGLAVVFAIAVLIINAYLRKLVKIKTSELIEIELRFKQLTENIDQVFWISSPDVTELFYVSSPFKKLWGVSESEILKTPLAWIDLIHPNDKNSIINFIKQNDLTKSVCIFPVFRIIRADNSVRYLQTKSYPIVEAKHNTSRIAGITEDISDQQKAEETLFRAENLLQSVIDNSPTLICAKDMCANFTIANRQFEIISDIPPRNFIGKNIFDILPHETASKIWENDLETISQNCPAVFEETLQHKDGSEHHYLSVKFPLHSDKGDLYNICSISIDVTEHLMTKEKLRLYEQIVNSSTDLMAYLNVDYTYQTVNQAYANVFDKTLNEIEGRKLSELVGEETFARLLKPKIDQCLKGENIRFQQWLDLPAWGKRFLDITYIPQVDKFGDVEGVIVGIHDSTAMKNAEDELSQHRDHLEELVKQRTTALESVNKELEAYSYSIAHDLRAPLRSVTSFSQILQEEAKNKLSIDEIEYLNRIIGAAKNMAHLIDDILELARISRSQFSLQTVNLSELSHTIISELEDQDPKRKVECTIDQNIKVKADAELMHVALGNLINNAWKYTGKKPKAKIHIGVQTDSNQIVFFVNDNGAGFDMRYADNLFKPFKRLHNKDDFEGTGIGLATVQRIIQRHGGKVWCDSKPGKGSTFYFSLSKHA